MLVNTRVSGTNSRRHSTLAKRAVKNSDGVYRLAFFLQYSMDIQDVILVLYLSHTEAEEIGKLVTRGQVLDLVQSYLTENGTSELATARTEKITGRMMDAAKNKVIRLFPDFFPMFARPRQ